MLLADFVQIIVATIFILLPGIVLLNWLGQGKNLGIGEHIGLASAVTIALYPLFHLWTYQFGLQIGFQLVWTCSTISLAILLWQSVFKNGFFRKPSFLFKTQFLSSLPQILSLVIVILLCFSRLYAIREMVAPAWGDSIQHTILAQLFIEHNGLFQSWQPYAHFDTFTYHFGFHLAAANNAWITGLPMPEVVLNVGQMLSVLAVLALYPVALRFSGGNHWAGLGTIIVGGFISQHPAFYVNWGRYTQLTGQVVLPGLIWAFDRWWNDEERPTWGHGILIILLTAGIALTHYRVAILSGAVGLVWTAWGAWRWRYNLAEWRARLLRLIVLAFIAALLITPWMRIVIQGKLPAVYGGMIQRTVKQPDTYSEIGIWRSIATFYPLWLWGSSLIILLWGMWCKPRHFVPLTLWGGAVFILTNPFLLQLPGTGWITNFLVVIALYIPLSLIIGWLIGELSRWLKPNYEWLLAGFCILATLWGTYQQEQIVDPFFQMVMPEDSLVFEWINDNMPAESYFAINGFLAYGDRTVVGSDAGWWLPYYTQRANTIPPLITIMESTQGDAANGILRQLHVDIRNTDGNATLLHDAFCHYTITHVYLGQKQGTVGFGVQQSIQEKWLEESSDFQLLHRVDQAQVWQFNSERCS